MQICCSTRSVILNEMATQYICSLNSNYCLHWLVQWNCHCLPMCIPVHSPWLPGYIDVTQTVLIILTVAGLFLDRPCISIFFHWFKIISNFLETSSLNHWLFLIFTFSKGLCSHDLNFYLNNLYWALEHYIQRFTKLLVLMSDRSDHILSKQNPSQF